MNQHVLLVDNHDSFTFNLVYDLEALGCTTEVYRNDVRCDFLLDRARATAAAFMLSPGPGGPADAGVCTELVRAAAGEFGVLGICLGHQVIVDAFGGRVGASPSIVHGRASVIHRADHALFSGLPAELSVGRYHSLAAQVIPDDLEGIATTPDGVVMAVAHRTARVAGFQFHPESILTTRGRPLLAGALAWVTQR
ncbi:MAG: aminodeoxychorismate/anthranilate synthase component II [Xanthomonadaceae bacterium]|nr:aminodeoxychorismate/anthranilate synthase component II [Xanthomonadaceae bacterium]